MAPAASILAAAAASSSKRPPASDAEHLLLTVDSSSSAVPPQGGDEEQAARSKSPQQPKQQLECPRCRSTNTKFCYYNNYSTAQPRHFCRACRRYWTHGGTLRDVPVGGATRRAKRRRAEPSSSPPQTATTAPAVELDACPPDLSASFPFLSDGSYLPQFDLGLFAPAPAAFSWPSAVAPDFYEGLAPPWADNGTVGVTGAFLGDIPGLEFTWPPPGN